MARLKSLTGLCWPGSAQEAGNSGQEAKIRFFLFFFFSRASRFFHCLFFFLVGLRLWTAECCSCYLIVEVVNLQLVASSAVGEVEAAVLLGAEQLCVLMLLHRRTLDTVGWRFILSKRHLSTISHTKPKKKKKKNSKDLDKNKILKGEMLVDSELFNQTELEEVWETLWLYKSTVANKFRPSLWKQPRHHEAELSAEEKFKTKRKTQKHSAQQSLNYMLPSCAFIFWNILKVK